MKGGWFRGLEPPANLLHPSGVEEGPEKTQPAPLRGGRRTGENAIRLVVLSFLGRVPHEYGPVSSALKISAYFLGTIVLGALLAPPLFWIGHTVSAHHPSLHWLSETDFQRYFNRAMFLAAVLLLWPAVRALRIGHWRDLGLQADPLTGRHIFFGIAAAGGMLWLLGLGLWTGGVYIPRSPIPWKVLGNIVLTAAAVSVLEEAFFRGALLGLVARGSRPLRGLVFISALFAVLHFLKPEENVVAPHAVGWLSGFVLLPHAFWQFSEPVLVLGGFTTLFCVGMILGWARLATRSLWLPIGLHAGWILGLRSFAKFSRHPADATIWFGDTLLVGLGSVVVVLLTGGLVWWVLRREGREAIQPV